MARMTPWLLCRACSSSSGLATVTYFSTFSRDQIRTDEHVSSDHPMVAQKVRINGAAAGILDLFAIDEMLQQVAI